MTDEAIHRLAIPTPFAVGRVNCYLIEDEPLTLVDCGPNSGTALDALERSLADRGRRVEDLERIVVTHQHLDHLGLIGILARRSGAEVVALDLLAPVIEESSAAAERNDALAAELMLRHGFPPDVVVALRAMARGFRAWGGSAAVTRTVRDGERLEWGARTMTVLHRPGHSPSDTLLWDERRALLIGGDHLIKHISSNPLISRPLGGKSGDPDCERPRALMRYLRSLRETRAMPVAVVLAGHGEPITDHAELIDERLRMHERRAGRIRRLIAERPRSAYELARELWGNVAVSQAFLTLSEVLGHVDLLIDRGKVAERELDGIVRFEVAG